jgi:hypothetical protein
MHNIKISKFRQVEKADISFPLVTQLFTLFKISQLFTQDDFSRGKGLTVMYLFEIVIKVVLTGQKSVYAGLCKLGLVSKKSTLNDFLNNPFFNWRDITMFVAKQYLRLFKPDADKPGVLIFDDSPKSKRSDKAEHVSKLYDTTENKYYYGYEFLLAAWSNIRSSIPLDFVIKTGDKLSSSKRCDYPQNSHISQRHRESRKTKITLVVDMMKRFLKHGISFKYVVWDAGYRADELYNFVYKRLVPNNVNLVTRLGLTDEKYIYKKKHLNIEQICRTLDNNWKLIKHDGIELECQSVEIEIEQKYKQGNLLRKSWRSSKNKRGTYVRNKEHRKIYGKAKLCIYRDVNKKNSYFVLLSTDLKQTAKDVLKIYAIRWSIELIFKDLKQYFGFDQSQSTKYAPQVADLSIKCAFYTMLCSLRERKPNKSMYQLLFEFVYEFERFCMHLYHIKMTKFTINSIIHHAMKKGVNELKCFKKKAIEITNEFFVLNPFKYKLKMIL